MSVVAIFNQKGGVGKTTTVLNLAAALAERGQQPLCLDLDPQAHLTAIAGLEPADSTDSMFGFFHHGRSLESLVRPWRRGRLIPAHAELCKIESLYPKGPETVMRLARAVSGEMLAGEGAPLLVDCCPMLGILSLNALLAADLVLIPISTDHLAVRGAEHLERTLRALEHVRKHRLRRLYLLTRYNARRRMAVAIDADLRQRWGNTVLATRIHENVAITESPAEGTDVLDHATGSSGAQDYRALAEEMLANGCVT